MAPLPILAALLVLAACGSEASGGDRASGATTTTVAAPTEATKAPASSTTEEPTVATEPPPTTVEAAPEATTTSTTTTTTSTTTTTAVPVEPAEPTTTVEPEPAVATYDFTAISPIVQDFIDEKGLNGAGLIVVQRDDGVVHHDHWGEFGPERISLIASSSKMVVAGVLMRLHDDGLLDIDAPVADVAGWGAGNPEVTPAQLISNSSGLVGLLPNPAYGPYVCQFLPIGTLQACAEQVFTTTDDDADIVPPDTEFRYGGAQWQVAGAVAEVASGKSWAALIDEVYVQPCGLDVLAFNNPFTQLEGEPYRYPASFDSDPSTLMPTYNPNLEGGAYVTTGDYGALLLMHLRDGMCGDNRVLSAESLDRMHSDRITAAYGSDAGGFGYGMGWWVDRENGRITDNGLYGTVPWLDLEDGYGAYLVVEADSPTGNALAGLLYEVVEEAVAGRSG
jgi:CubicO group peptidase (beta-lactamase class C family)